MQRKSILVFALASAAIVGAIGYGVFNVVQRQAVNAAKEKQRAQIPELTFRANELTVPKRQALNGAIEWTGTVTAADQAIVKAKINGTLSRLTVTEGDAVKAGQSLATITVADAGARMAERDAGVQAAKSALKAAQTLHQSNLQLVEKNFISPVAVENSRNQLEAAQAQLRTAQAALEATTSALREAQILAPINGKVIKRQITLGEKVSIEQPLLVISSTGKLEVVGNVSLHQTAKLQPGQAVTIQIEGQAKPLEGKIARIAPAAEAGTRAMPVVVALEAGGAGQNISPGQFATLQVALQDGDTALTIPVSAVQIERGLPTVWLLENNQLKRRVIKIGRRDANGQLLSVTEGLAGTETLLATRFDNLRDGQKANVASAK
jgi:membrane fusion protein, multidrug efflux system